MKIVNKKIFLINMLNFYSSIITANTGPTITYSSKYHPFSNATASIIGLSAKAANDTAMISKTIIPNRIKYLSKSALKNSFI